MTRTLLLIALAALAAPVGARPAEDLRSVSLPVETASLAKPRVVAALRTRIARAAAQVCAPYTRSLHDQSLSRKCRDAASEEANNQLNAMIAGQRVAAARF